MRQPPQAAAFSQFAERSPTDDRSGLRLCTIVHIGKLLSGAGEALCRVRNISSNGFMADLCPPPAAGEEVVLELWEGQGIAARVVWTQGGQFGAKFLAPQPVAELIADPLRRADRQYRAMRVTPRGGFATILDGGRASRATILNISQTGTAVFAYDLRLAADAGCRLSIEIDGLDPMIGLLSWAGDGAAGIQFQAPLSFETLSHWLWATSLAEPRPPILPSGAGAIHGAGDPSHRRTSG